MNKTEEIYYCLLCHTITGHFIKVDGTAGSHDIVQVLDNIGYGKKKKIKYIPKQFIIITISFAFSAQKRIPI